MLPTVRDLSAIADEMEGIRIKHNLRKHPHDFTGVLNRIRFWPVVDEDLIYLEINDFQGPEAESGLIDLLVAKAKDLARVIYAVANQIGYRINRIHLIMEDNGSPVVFHLCDDPDQLQLYQQRL